MHILPHWFLQSWGLNWGILTTGQVSALTLTPNHRSSLSYPVFLCQANTERRVCTSQRKAAWAWRCPVPATCHFSDSFGWCSKLLLFRISLLPAPPNSQACLLDVSFGECWRLSHFCPCWFGLSAAFLGLAVFSLTVKLVLCEVKLVIPV